MSFFFSSRRRHTRSCLVSWARRCVQETDYLHLYLEKQRKQKKKKNALNRKKFFFLSNQYYQLLSKQNCYIKNILVSLQEKNIYIYNKYTNHSSLILECHIFVQFAKKKYIYKQTYIYISVSYTHLTLPTICSVYIQVVAVPLKKKIMNVLL
eukprot:TRINITY_DN5521_c0_g1_i1.p3 TRINITY_DN5521_c0_g1~~TRINITY_DN5521_c0_g1_i1.p3  ORF type:complete len:152 (-),score=28.07 TRINITY_DN5521_c0_g1_i1:51-506(-)